MKHIILTWSILLFAVLVNAQCPDQSTWDMTDQNSTNWQAYLPPGSVWQMTSPFIGTTSGDIRDINIANDIGVTEGWVLLYKDFGCLNYPIQGAYPYFVMYNRFRGVVRLYQFNAIDQQYTKALVTAEIGSLSEEQASIFTLNNELALPNDEYYPVPNQTTDRAMNYVQDYSSNGSWFVTDFSVTFDHNIDNDVFYDLEFKTFSVLSRFV